MTASTDNEADTKTRHEFNDLNLPTEEQFLVYEAFRRRIVDEDQLINHRTTWQLAIQTLLIAIWAALLTSSADGQFLSGLAGFVRGLPMAFLCGVGIIVSVSSYFTVAAAHVEMKKARDAYKLQYPALYHDVGVPKLTGSTQTHNAGHIVPFLVPGLFGLIQSALFVVSLYAGTLVH